MALSASRAPKHYLKERQVADHQLRPLSPSCPDPCGLSPPHHRCWRQVFEVSDHRATDNHWFRGAGWGFCSGQQKTYRTRAYDTTCHGDPGFHLVCLTSGRLRDAAQLVTVNTQLVNTQ